MIHHHWRDVEETARRLTDSDRRLLFLLAQLPLVPIEALARLRGLRGGASIYRRLKHLQAAGLVDAVMPASQPGRSAALWRLTDLGVATVTLAWGVEPAPLARRYGLRGGDLRAALDRLPSLLALYRLLAALAASRAGRPDLRAWARPWRATYPRLRAKRAGHVRLPGYAALAWGEQQTAAYLLLPDLGSVPLRASRRTIGQLLAYRAAPGEATLPPLLIVTASGRRAAAWTALLDEVSAARREAVLAAHVVTWERLDADLTALPAGTDEETAPVVSLGRGLPALRARAPTRSLP